MHAAQLATIPFQGQHSNSSLRSLPGLSILLRSKSHILDLMPTLTDLHFLLLSVIVRVEIISKQPSLLAPVYSRITFNHTDSSHHRRETRRSRVYTFSQLKQLKRVLEQNPIGFVPTIYSTYLFRLQ
jgi:hypothetical protein